MEPKKVRREKFFPLGFEHSPITTNLPIFSVSIHSFILGKCYYMARSGSCIESMRPGQEILELSGAS